MKQIVLDVAAGQITAELRRLRIGAGTRVRAVVELVETPSPPETGIAMAEDACDWLTDEPDLCSDADLLPSG